MRWPWEWTRNQSVAAASNESLITPNELKQIEARLELDDQEQRFVDEAVERDHLLSRLKDERFPEKDAAFLSEKLFWPKIGEALDRCAEQRLREHNLKGAARSAIRALGFNPNTSRYFILAEIYARHGDTSRASSFFRQAKRLYRTPDLPPGIRENAISHWEENCRRLEGLIQGKSQE